MADEVPPNASEHEILEHLTFLDVCIESLEPDDPDYDTEIANLQSQKAEANIKLNALQQPDPSAPSPAADMTSRSSSPRHFALKRHATANLDEHERRSKRPTPDRSQAPTPSSSASSFETIERPSPELTERIRMRQLAAEAALRRQREDEAFARSLAQEFSTPNPAATNSSRVQTTLGSSGSLQRPPRTKLEPLPTPGPSRFSLPLPLSQHASTHHGVQPVVKTEPSAFSHRTDQQRTSDPDVIDLTGVDDGLPVVNRPTGLQLPGMSNFRFALPRPSPSMPSLPSMPPRPSMPGAYPIMPTFSSYQSVYGPSSYNAQRLPSHTGHPSSSRNPYSLGSSAWPAIINDDHDDDDFTITGSTSRALQANIYAGREDLYQSRYDEIANYDPAKTMEEINSLLSNIRPDEEMPAHLRVVTPHAMTIKLHKYQELGLTWLKNCEEGANKGGILADDMGLGKTVQMLALMVERKSDNPENKTTLIIAPVALLRQWQQEIEQKIKPGSNRLSVYVHHGSRKKSRFSEFQSYDVVITTYGSLAAEMKKLESWKLRLKNNPDARMTPKERCVLIGDECRWYRIILDEAQCIKNSSTQTHKAATYLRADYRFCVTGTPMMNNVDELGSLITFLGIRPFHNRQKFSSTFSRPLKGNGNEASKEAAMSKLQALCKAVMLRRNKNSTFEGKPILVLPEKAINIDHPVFDEAEKEFYAALEKQTALTFNKYYNSGTVGRSYSAILVLLLRLRQACCHPHLIKDFGVSAAAGISQNDMTELAKQLEPQVVERIREKRGNFDCPVCWDAALNPAIFIPCGHESCPECFAKFTDPANALQAGNENGTKSRCPNCRGEIDTKKVIDFETFKQVHQPELIGPAEAEDENVYGPANAGEDSETESESGSTSEDAGDEEDEDSDDEHDGGSDLDDFIVSDGHVSDDEDNDEELETKEVKGKGKGKAKASIDDDMEDDDAQGTAKPAKASSKKSKKSKKKRKSKGKGKKGDSPRKPRYKELTLGELKKRAQSDKSCRGEYFRRLRENWTSSAKIEKTLEILRTIMSQPEGEQEKVLVFSQWTSLLDLIEVPVDKEKWKYRRYDGSMSANARAEAVDDFRDTKKNIRIMLVSLKAGNAGLNLNMASQVIILDPFWNPYIEEQAVDRAHRLGQTRPVIVHRLLIEQTVEDRIMELQEKKRALISQALDEKAGQSLARLGVRELAYLFNVNLDQRQPYQERRSR